MPKTGGPSDPFDPTDYAPVAERITRFYALHPHGRIVTRARSVTERMVLFEAMVYRAKSDAEPAATGWASEAPGDGDINTVACVENTETSAIGRALANLGLTAARARPSREEMASAERRRREPFGRGADGTSRSTRPGAGSKIDRAHRAPPRALPPLATADDFAELRELLADAQRRGFPEMRAAEILGLMERGAPASSPEQEALVPEPVLLSTVARVQRRLRQWLERHRAD